MSKKTSKRKICFVITSSVHYSRSKLILKELKDRKDIELQVVVAASAVLPTYSDTLSMMEKDGFKVDEKITMVLEGGNNVAMAKTTGMGIIEFTTVFDNLSPDMVVVRGDRYEVLSPVIAAAYLNKTIAHIEGGDISGNIDESVRHAITKLSHIHLTTNSESKRRVLKMGENPKYVFDVGGPEMEFISGKDFKVSNKLINYLGVGDKVDLNKPYLIVMQHPVTSEQGKNYTHIEETLNAISELQIPTIWFWPNVDAGTDEVSKGIRTFREMCGPSHIRFIKYLSPEEFIGLLKNTVCLVGNSSSGIKECSYLGVPAVNIGTRQNMRLRAKNVVDAPYDKEKIKEAILSQVKHGRYPQSNIYFKPGSGRRIADILASADLYTQKFFHDDWREEKIKPKKRK